MNSLRRNATANVLGTAFVACVYFLVLPIYLHLLGADRFGLIGVFFALSGIAAALDLGIGAALNRVLAQRSATLSTDTSMRDAVHTFGLVLASASFVLGLLLIVWLPDVASSWLKPGDLDVTVLKTSLQWMGVALAVQMLISLYTNALWGLQKQIAYNIANSLMIGLRLIGAAGLVWWIDADIVSFFVWHAVFALIHVVVLWAMTWYYLPRGVKAIFDSKLLKETKQFVVEMACATLLANLSTNMDKIILSRILTLKDFGYYMMAWSIASVLGRIASPIYSAWVPRLTQYVALSDSVKLKHAYRSGLKLLCGLLLPIAVALATFSYLILYLYTKNQELAQTAYLALSVLAIGSACNGLLLIAC
jgi:O-antigen/teichoic acid export membrane protein